MLAGKQFNIPVVGTMAHSWIMAFDDELTAFQEYARLMPDNVILLVDTYDTMTGVDHAITIGKKLKGIRLDSGDLLSLSKMAREKLNQAGLYDTQIFASGDLTEDRLIDLKSCDAPINGWGVGTHLSTAYEQPALDMVYKLGAIEKNARWQYKMKCTDNHIKTSDPGILQVKRFYDGKKWLRDLIYHVDLGIAQSELNLAEKSQDLLIPIFKNGTLIYSRPSLSDSRNFCREQVKAFNASKAVSYSVQRDQQLIILKKQCMDSAQ
ncbi:MAG: Nicotinate phosphoribosyltransferase [uncultured bacterium]|nr:MAG: Nicotinate phosphoribosyltransferase [uncultured bacterium]